jgi:hypothetical protein
MPKREQVGAESYRDFLNYLHNELGISKEDIRVWTMEAVERVATTYVNNNLSDRKIDEVLKGILTEGSWLRNQVGPDIRKGLIEELAKQITIGVK